MTKIEKLYEKVYLYSINASYILYFIALIGVGGFAPYYLDHLKTFLKIYVGLLLFFRYNPITYREKKFSDFDRRLVFSSSIFLLLSTTLIGGIERYIHKKSKQIVVHGINKIKQI
jgi:hypothetical protein